MDTLVTLKEIVEENKKRFGPDMTISLKESILSMLLHEFSLLNVSYTIGISLIEQRPKTKLTVCLKTF